MNKSIVLKIFILIFFSCYLYNNLFFENMLVGTYVVKYSNNSSSAVELPSSKDTLIILKDKKFKSSNWGEGKYDLSYSIRGTKINLHYKYEFGTAGFSTSLNRNWLFGKTKIMLDYDSDLYFEKID